MRRAAFAALVLSLVAGCAATAERIRGPEGGRGEWYEIRCRRDPANCREKAEEVCPDGYELADREDSSGVYAQRVGYGVYAQRVYSGAIIVRCRHGE